MNKNGTNESEFIFLTLLLDYKDVILFYRIIPHLILILSYPLHYFVSVPY